MSLRGRPGNTALIAVVVAFLTVTGCGSAAPPSTQPAASTAPAPAGTNQGSPNASGETLPGVTVEPPTLPSLDDAIPQAADADVALVHELQVDAGIAALLGPSGQAAIDGIDASQTTFAQNDLPGLVQQMGVPTASRYLIASVGVIDSGLTQESVATDWEPSFLSRSAFTVSMLTGLLAGVIANADVDQPKGSEGKTENYDKTTEGIHEHTSIQTTFTIQTGGGRMLAEVELVTTTTATDSTTGATVGSLTSTANGHIDLNACPDAQGNAQGTISIAWQEGIDRSGLPGASAGATFDAPITLVDGEDAHLIKTDMNLGFTKDASGPGTPGSDQPAPFDWNVGGSTQVVVPAVGGSIDVSGTTTQAHGATASQTSAALGSALTQASLIVFQVAAEAEKFWRSGKCIELKPSEDSQDVDPGQSLDISVDATQKFDGSEIKAPITATFSGTKSIEPANQPVDPPASFTFIAGQNPGDTGTVNLKQTSRRGIGMKTLTFKVNQTLSIQMDGTYTPPFGTSATITLAKTKMTPQGNGTFTVSVDADVSGTVGSGGCSKNFSDELPLKITATLDEADSTRATLFVQVDGGTGLLQETLKCNGITTLAPVPLNLWVGSFTTSTGPVTITVNSPATITGSGGSKGARTNVDLEQEDAQ